MEALKAPLGKRGGQRCSAGDLVALEDDPAVGVVRRDARPAVGPAGAGGQVHAQAEPFGFAGGVVEHLHPFRRQIVNEAVLVAVSAVNGADFDAAHAGLLEHLKLAGEVGLVHRAAHPPPARPRLGGLRRGGPTERVGVRGGGGLSARRPAAR